MWTEEREAARLYCLTADQGHAGGQYNLGVCYKKGQGVPQDWSEAARLYRLAADRGNVHAQFNLGQCSTQGRGV